MIGESWSVELRWLTCSSIHYIAASIWHAALQAHAPQDLSDQEADRPCHALWGGEEAAGQPGVGPPNARDLRSSTPGAFPERSGTSPELPRLQFGAASPDLGLPLPKHVPAPVTKQQRRQAYATSTLRRLRGKLKSTICNGRWSTRSCC